MVATKKTTSKTTNKRSLDQRLNIIKGQIDGLSDLIKENQDCERIVMQLYAINSGVKKVMELYFKENFDSCVRSSQKVDKEKLNFLLKEIIKNK